MRAGLRRLRLLAVAVLPLLALSMTPALARPPELPVPDDATVSIVGDGMKVNGLLTDVREIRTRDSVDEVVQFYKDEWEDPNSREPSYLVNRVTTPWTVVSRIEDGFLLTVQIKPANDGGTYGFLSRAKLPTSTRSPKLGSGFPAMRGSATMNELVTRDTGQSGRTLLVANKYDLASNVSFYRSHYEARGWEFDMDQRLGQVMHVFALRKGRDRVNLVMTTLNRDGTRIVVNEVTYDLL